MNAEIKIKNGNLIIEITDITAKVTKEFGPFGFSEAEEIIRNYDKLREMFNA